jgi:hypothetical protein
MTDFPSPAELAPVMFPEEMRRAFGIVAAQDLPEDQPFRFRAAPGAAFEIRGVAGPYQPPWGPSRYCLAVKVRHRPYQEPIDVAFATFDDPGEITRRLPDLIGFARQMADRVPHWRQVSQRDREPWTLKLPAAPGSAELGQATTADRARRLRRTHFTYPQAGWFVCASSAPPAGVCFSVTACGEWSCHDGARTIPLAQQPAATSYQRTSPPLVAARDVALNHAPPFAPPYAVAERVPARTAHLRLVRGR